VSQLIISETGYLLQKLLKADIELNRNFTEDSVLMGEEGALVDK